MYSEDLKNLFIPIVLVAIFAPLLMRKLALDILRLFYEENYPGDYWIDYVESGEFRKSNNAFEKIVIEVFLFLDEILLAKIKSIPILVMIFSGLFCFWVIYRLLNT